MIKPEVYKAIIPFSMMIYMCRTTSLKWAIQTNCISVLGITQIISHTMDATALSDKNYTIPLSPTATEGKLIGYTIEKY